MAYFYLLQHKQSGKKYAGVRYAKGCDPRDLLVKYFTSSRIVKKMLLEDPTCFEIIDTKIFENNEDAILYEVEFIKKHNAHLSEDWFNQTAGKAINPEIVKKTCLEKYGVENWTQTEEYKNSGLGFQPGNTYGCFPRSEETKRKISISFTGRIFTEDHKQKIREGHIGLKASEEAKQKMSDARKGKPRPRSFSKKMSVIMKGENNPMYGKTSPRRGMRDPVIICEYCGKEANKGNYNRWHGDKCRHKPQI